MRRRTYREILEGCKYSEGSNKGKGKKKGLAKIRDEKQLTLPLTWNEDLRNTERKDEKHYE